MICLSLSFYINVIVKFYLFIVVCFYATHLFQHICRREIHKCLLISIVGGKRQVSKNGLSFILLGNSNDIDLLHRIVKIAAR